MYDSIHIAKNVRNNWLNKKDFDKTFFYPSFDDFTKIRCARFKDLRDLYHDEFITGQSIKKAFKLNKTTLYPSKFERQRVPYLLNIIHPSTISALREHLTIDETEGTADFLELWRKIFCLIRHQVRPSWKNCNRRS